MISSRSKGLLALSISSALIIFGCQSSYPGHTSNLNKPSAAATQPVNYPGLYNLVSYTDKIISGSAPEGREGFESIRAMGIKTVITVDGAKPDVELAREKGLKYIHLPIGYNGLSHERTLEIARAIQLADGPVYLHCHHGKHRSAGAAAAAAVTLGLLTNEEAVAKMKISGTADAYTGLYRSARVAKPDVIALAQVKHDFPEVCQTGNMVDAMVSIDETMELLKGVEKAAWKTPVGNPDLVPAAEAGKLGDQLRIAHGIPGSTDFPQAFFDLMKHASKSATTLEEGLVAGNLPVDELGKRFKLVGQSCKDCHTAYRDPVVPQ